MENKFRIALCKDFSKSKLLYTYVKDIEDAKCLLKKLADSGKYQSENNSIPGLSNLAALERWNEEDQEWEFWIE